MTPAVRPEPAAAVPRPGSRRVAVAAAAALLLLLGWLDYTTGYELGFFVFYSAPVGLAAWHGGRWPGVAMALVASLACSLADKLDGLSYSSRFYFYWNLAVHFTSFLINALAAVQIRRTVDERAALRRELDALRSAPPCPACGGPRVPPAGPRTTA